MQAEEATPLNVASVDDVLSDIRMADDDAVKEILSKPENQPALESTARKDRAVQRKAMAAPARMGDAAKEKWYLAYPEAANRLINRGVAGYIVYRGARWVIGKVFTTAAEVV